jgi:transposase
LPYADTEAMQLHLDEISRHVAKGAHAVLLLDRAGWHTTGNLDMPENITPIFLPSRAPELNPVENVCQYLRSNWLSNRVFDTYDAIIDAACEVWMNSCRCPTPSPQSRCEAGRTSIRSHGPWYNNIPIYSHPALYPATLTPPESPGRADRLGFETAEYAQRDVVAGAQAGS